MMKINLIVIILGVFCWAGGLSAMAQKVVGLYQPLTWEQASLVAARENKLVLVNIGSFGTVNDLKSEKKILGNGELMNFMGRNVVVIQIDAATPEGQAFVPRLLLHPYPAYAFFMPYGDLLEVVETVIVHNEPLALKAAGERALELAAVKKSNTRSIHFEPAVLEEALTEVGREEKMVFVEVYKEDCQPCLMMEKNVFTLDRVADFYNRHFVNVRLSVENVREVTGRYTINEYPAFLFMNAGGKLVYKVEGYCTADKLIGYGEEALEKAKGIAFSAGDSVEVRMKARQERKMIFMDLYAPADAGHKELVRTVFRDPDVTELFNAHFVNVMKETSDGAAFVFTDAGGREVHRVIGRPDDRDLMVEARRALSGKGVSYADSLYGAGCREPQFVEEYIHMLGRAGRSPEAGVVAGEYLAGLDVNKLKEKKFWELFDDYVTDVNSDLFKYVYGNRSGFYLLFGEQAVKSKVTAMWIAGAENFVRNSVFDEAGFNGYVKRMKREKAEGWRKIARDARMNAAERTGDWRTYVELAEEKWAEEQIPDAELYGWGQIINQRCHDEAIRFKAARWFALAAAEMERREQVSGKIKVSSYKGFFEKLVDDLVRNK